MRKIISIIIINILILITSNNSYATDVQVNTASVQSINWWTITLNYALSPSSWSWTFIIWPFYKSDDEDTTSLIFTWSINNTLVTDCDTSAVSFINPTSTEIINIENAIPSWTFVCDYYIDFKLPESLTDWEYIISHSTKKTNPDTGDITLTSEGNTIVTILTTNRVQSGETSDSNSNWFIDTIKLVFARPLLHPDTFSAIWLRIGTLTNISLFSVIDNVVLLNFQESKEFDVEDEPKAEPDTWFVPQVVHTWSMFEWIDPIEPIHITEVDRALPVVFSINWQDPTWDIDISENASLKIKFSEDMYIPSILNSFQIIEKIWESEDVLINTDSLIWIDNMLTYCKWWYDSENNCNEYFNVNAQYLIKVGSWMTDYLWNEYLWWDLEVSISFKDITSPIWTSLTHNWETNVWIIINWNTSNNNYINSAWLVSLKTLANDNKLVTEMCISDVDFLTDDVNKKLCWTWWKSYPNSSNFTLTWDQWLKLLYVKFKDTAWNVSSTYNDSITWDAVSPTTSSNPATWYYQNLTDLNIQLTCVDSNSLCLNTYYTFDDWVTTNTYNSTTWIENISWEDETLTLKYYSVDNSWNIESTSNIENYFFSNSYILFSNTDSITSEEELILNWTCNESDTAETTMEYTIDEWNSYTDLNCNSNTWIINGTLNLNILNKFKIRFKTHTWVTSSYSITHDNIYPDSLNILINNSDIYSSTVNVILSISWNDMNWIDKMMISEDISFTWSIWQNYSSNIDFTLSTIDETKTVYIKLKDYAWNISTISNDQITLETSIPTFTSSLITGSYNTWSTVLLNSDDQIYYSIDESLNPSNFSTSYSTGILLWESEWLVNLKVIAYWISWIPSSVISYEYNFKCNDVSHWTVINYPACELTCDRLYTKEWDTCLAPASSWGGGWWGNSTPTDYELEKYISRFINSLKNTITDIYSKIWILDISNMINNQLTSTEWSIELKAWVKSNSSIYIDWNTSIVWTWSTIYAPYWIDIISSNDDKYLKIENIDYKKFNTKKLFFTWNKEKLVKFNKNIQLNFDLWDPIEWKIHVFYSDSIDWNFKLTQYWLETDKYWIISLETTKLWYFAFIKEVYIPIYFPNLNTDISEVWNDTEDIGWIWENEIIIEKSNIKESLKAKISNNNLYWLIDKFYLKLKIKDIDYYTTFDKDLENKYNKVLKWYNDFFVYIDKYLTNKNIADRTLAWKGYLEYLKIDQFNNLEDRYITKTYKDWKVIYKSKYEPIKKIVDALESKMIIKLNNLLNSNTITLDKYNETIDNYNQFILHLSIYKQYNNKTAALKALNPGKKFLEVYKMKVIYAPEINTYKEEVITKKIILIKDEFIFERELKFWDYNKDVQNLQEIMKSYGYFTHPQTTMYFWNVTKESFINFSKDILNSSSSDWILTKSLIEKLNLIKYKD